MKSNRVSIFVNVRTDRGYKASTGLSINEFNRLLVIFSNYYQPKTYQLSETYTMGHAIQDPAEALFFILFLKKPILLLIF